MIPFNKPPLTGHEQKYIKKAIHSDKISGSAKYTKKCEAWFKKKLGCKKALLTPSCTHALEMCAILLDIKQGDEVIMPSYTFVSTANAFVLRGAKIVFVDVRADTLNIDERKIESAISEKTKAIVVVHYAGVSCEMDAIMSIAKKHKLFVVEDAAQAVESFYERRPLGSIGHLATFSFHETKNITSAGEGGLLSINDERFVKRAEIIREKGTNRNAFFRGEVDKYSWVDVGSSYLLNDISAAYLWGQLKKIDTIQNDRLKSWNSYHKKLLPLEKKGFIVLPKIPKKCTNNAHIFYIHVKDLKTRTKLLSFLKSFGIFAVFHYVPLHCSEAGRKFGTFVGNDESTTKQSERIVRLPLYYGLSKKNISFTCSKIRSFFEQK